MKITAHPELRVESAELPLALLNSRFTFIILTGYSLIMLTLGGWIRSWF